MKEIIVKTQKEFDAIKLDFDGVIRVTDTSEWININARPNATIYVSGSATIESVYGSATIESVSGSATIESVYGSATIKSVSGSATIEYVYGSATIESVYGSATIEYVSGSATIKYVSGSATIKSVYGSATIESVYGSATIEYVYGSATIKYVSGSATIESVSGSATIKYVYGYVAINFIAGRAQVNCFGINTVRYFETEKDIKVKASKDTTVVVIPAFDPSFDHYKKLYPVTTKGKNAILYKAVHKNEDGTFRSDHTRSFKYEIGKVAEEVCSDSKEQSCTNGLHVSHLVWALNFGKGWDDLAILECQVATASIVVAKDCDGKVRTSKLKVLREVPKDEWWG